MMMTAVRFSQSTPLPRFSAVPKTPLTRDELAQKQQQISFRDHYYLMAHEQNGNLFQQVQYDAPDVGVPGSKPTGRTGTTWWPIPKDFSLGQIFQRAMLALYSVEEHELRENFRHQGLKIFNPHFVLDNLIGFLRQRQSQPTAPDTVHNNVASVQTLLNDTTIMEYGFKVENVIPVSADKQVIVVQIVEDPAKPVDPNPVAHDLKDKKLTFLTGNTSGKILRNLMEEIINEQKAEVRHQLTLDGFAPFSNEVPMSHLIEYAAMRKAKKAAKTVPQTP